MHYFTTKNKDQLLLNVRSRKDKHVNQTPVLCKFSAPHFFRKNRVSCSLF